MKNDTDKGKELLKLSGYEDDGVKWYEENSYNNMFTFNKCGCDTVFGRMYISNISTKSICYGKRWNEKMKTARELLKTAYDIIGTIAVLEIDSDLDDKASDIAERLLQCNSKIKTVVRKKGNMKEN